jgi:hypothetical protein
MLYQGLVFRARSVQVYERPPAGYIRPCTPFGPTNENAVMASRVINKIHTLLAPDRMITQLVALVHEGHVNL